MSAITTVIGLGISAFLILYFVLAQAERHWILKLIGFFFFGGILLIIPNVIIHDQAAGCTGITNVTRSGNTTSYTYGYACDSPTEATANRFNNLIIWFYRLLVAYIFIFFFWDVTMRVKEWLLGMFKGKKKGGGEQ